MVPCIPRGRVIPGPLRGYQPKRHRDQDVWQACMDGLPAGLLAPAVEKGAVFAGLVRATRRRSRTTGMTARFGRLAFLMVGAQGVAGGLIASDLLWRVGIPQAARVGLPRTMVWIC